MSRCCTACSVADPYRYLEDPDADRTRAFVDAQNALSGTVSRRPCRHAAWFLELTTALLTAPRRGVPWERGGRYFVIANPGELDQDQLFTAATLDELFDAPRLLRRPEHAVRRRHHRDDGRAGEPGRHASWPTRCPRPGRTGGPSGSARSTPAVDLPDELTWTKWIDPTWLPDESGFLYWRYPATGGRRVHRGDGRRRADAAPARRRPGRRRAGLVAGRRAEWMADPWVAADGRWLVLTSSPGHRLPEHGARPPADAWTMRRSGTGSTTSRSWSSPNWRMPTTSSDPTATPSTCAPNGTPRAGGWWPSTCATPDARGPRVDRPARDRRAGRRAARPRSRSRCSGRPTRRTGSRSSTAPACHRDWPDLPAPISVTAVNSRDSSTEIFVGVTSFTSRARSLRLDLVRRRGLRLPTLPQPGGEIALPDVRVERRARPIQRTGSPCR